MKHKEDQCQESVRESKVISHIHGERIEHGNCSNNLYSTEGGKGMAKKIRFPLDMGNGVEVRTLEELKANFSIEKVLGYYTDGKLITWLRDRYLDDIADKLMGIDKDDTEISKKICNVFDVEYKEENVDLETIKEKNRKLAILKDYTTDEKFFDVVDDIAFEQDDIYDLLDEGKITIYLCGEKFSIPLSKKGICYIGVNSPEVVISSKEIINFEEREIRFENVRFDEQYQSLFDENELDCSEKLYIDGKVQEAFSIFEEEAKEDNGRAMFFLGEIYSNGYWGFCKDKNLAKQWRKKGYEKGDVLAKINYAFMLEDESEKVRIVKSCVKELMTISENSIVAKYELANLYLSSKYVDADYGKCIMLLTECANAGYWLAMDKLGYIYYNGTHVEKDYEQAVFWYRKAADTGYSKAQCNLADCYYEGKGVEVDEKKAFNLYLLSAEQNEGRAQNNLAALYYQGKGVEKDFEKSIYWFSKAAEKNVQGAQNNLYAILGLEPENEFLGAYNGAIYCRQHVENLVEKVCEIYWAKGVYDKRCIYVDRCESMSFSTKVEFIHNDKYAIITISNADTNTILQLQDGNVIKMDQWNLSGMPIYAELNGNRLEYGEKVLGNRQSRNVKFL